ncbi:hypothetical protein [Sphingobium sp.]|uniref:hypothetical protein n=1 Tax=Sphingobium sp. TaxID=1912891 RepID=UPI0028BE483C|nr:hypothetical protein [Sphingobium sp.]
MGLFSVETGAQTLTITATGQIPASCGLGSGSGFINANLDANGSLSATATVNCNTKYLLRATSANGGLKTATLAPSASFSSKLDYQFDISVPLDNSSGSVSGGCVASKLTAGGSDCALSPAGAGLSSVNGTSTGKTATLGISWMLPGATHLVAGSYADTITISIAAQP